VLLAAVPDVEERLESVLGYLHNDLSRRRMSCGLALRVLGRSVDDPMARRRCSATT
jgi:hypothetical protein